LLTAQLERLVPDRSACPAARPLPRSLRPGARVGIVGLSGPPPASEVAAGIEVLRGAGYGVVCASNLGAREHYLAGDDDARLHGLVELLEQGVDALIAARGGYGIMRVLPRLPWQQLAAWGGWVVGFSDVTALHAALSTRFPNVTLHAPMVTSLTRNASSTRRLFAWLEGRAESTIFSLVSRDVVRAGTCAGIAVGGTLAMLAALVGTPYEPEYEGAVLFIEDVGEPLYRLDRLLTQLVLSSRLARVHAIVAGRFTRCGRGDPSWRERFRGMLAAAAPNAVVCEGLPFGHGNVNLPVPLGVEVVVDTRRGVIAWGGA
jgi:muramoyltetrapeptide carboxypeptidase